jgi:hypothetical protein
MGMVMFNSVVRAASPPHHDAASASFGALTLTVKQMRRNPTGMTMPSPTASASTRMLPLPRDDRDYPLICRTFTIG